MKSIVILIAIGMMLIASCSYAQQSFPRQAQVISNDANVRADSTTSAEIITKLNQGNVVTVVKENFEWYAIRLPAETPCYVYANYITRLSESSGVINSENVNIRLKADKKSVVLGKIDQGTSVIIKSTVGDWYVIEAPAQAIGWMHKSLLRPTILNVPATPEQSVSSITPTVLTQNRLAPINTVNSIEITGLLHERGKTFGFIKKNISHSVTTDDNKTYLVRGEKESLALHTNYRVTIKGIIEPESATSNQPIIDAEEITRVK